MKEDIWQSNASPLPIETEHANSNNLIPYQSQSTKQECFPLTSYCLESVHLNVGLFYATIISTKSNLIFPQRYLENSYLKKKQDSLQETNEDRSQR